MKKLTSMAIVLFSLVLLAGCKSSGQNASQKTNQIYNLNIVSAVENEDMIYHVWYPDTYYAFDQANMKCAGYKMSNATQPENMDMTDFTYITEYVENLPENNNFSSNKVAYKITMNYYDASGKSHSVFVKGYDELPDGWNDFIDKVNQICGDTYLAGEGEIATVTPEFLQQAFGVTDEDVYIGTLEDLIIDGKLELDDVADFDFNMRNELDSYYADRLEPVIKPYRPTALTMQNSTAEEYDLFVDALLNELGGDWEETDSEQAYLRMFQSADLGMYFYLGRSADLDKIPVNTVGKYYRIDLDTHMEYMINSVDYYYSADQKFILLSGGGSSVEESGVIIKFIYLDAQGTANGEINDSVMEDYETSLTQAIDTVSTQLTDGIPVDEISLPSYIHIMDSCEGDMDQDLYKDIALVLEFTEEVPDEKITGFEHGYGRRVLCVFKDTGLGQWECMGRNSKILLQTEQDTYGDIVIEDGKLFLSIGGDTPCKWNNTYRFGYVRTGKSLCLEHIEDWQTRQNTDAGFYIAFDYDTGVITYHNIKDHKKESTTGLYRIAMFPVDKFAGGPAFEEVEVSEEHSAKPTEFFYEEADKLKPLYEEISLEAGTEIEYFEWVGEGEHCLRVGICYEEEQEDAYQHKEDYWFFYDEQGNFVQVLHEDYEGIHIGSGCDFDAHFEDVTFDGYEDLIVSVGDGRYERYYTAYVYENGKYVYKKSFEQIPTYKVDAENKIITGEMGPAHDTTYYTFGYENGEFILLSEKKEP